MQAQAVVAGRGSTSKQKLDAITPLDPAGNMAKLMDDWLTAEQKEAVDAYEKKLAELQKCSEAPAAAA